MNGVPPVKNIFKRGGEFFFDIGAVRAEQREDKISVKRFVTRLYRRGDGNVLRSIRPEEG